MPYKNNLYAGGLAEKTRLTFTSYNCKSFGEDKHNIVENFINNSSFVLLQEHWQYEKQFIERIKGIKSNIECVVSSPMNENITNIGRGKGGVAIIWKNNIKCKTEIINCLSKRLCTGKVTVGDS